MWSNFFGDIVMLITKLNSNPFFFIVIMNL
jgi:hypothetical protein